VTVSAKDIDALLPQTQCGECGFPGCLPYAQALAQGGAPINRCPPGGVDTVKALGQLLSIDPEPYLEAAKQQTRAPSLAVIREAECIGCTKCIQACPVDAIIGSGKLMHSIINHECTGCGLCVEPCPVDCIDIIEQPSADYNPNQARARFHAKQIRALRDEQEKQQNYREKRRLNRLDSTLQHDKQAKQDYILQALARSQGLKKK
jgi:electron transport complex protein RnfB